MPIRLPTLPAEVNTAREILQSHLAESLRAIYLHGSAVADGLRPHSDIDLLVVVDQPIAPEIRRHLTTELMAISGRYPSDPAGRRPLEVLIFLRADLEALPYPARCELMYGEWLRHDYEAGAVSEPVSDPELTVVLAHARPEAIPLSGPSATDLLPAVSEADIRRAMKDGLPALMTSLPGDERNVLLTLARMWHTLATGEFVSKDKAADWAAARLPHSPAAVLTNARNDYMLGTTRDWQACQPALRQTASAMHDQVRANL
ncbi:hypothetical protein B7P02_15740 [Bordetella bronchiseptica]|nr:hypothetical protein B7P02_15740 [Bordetella bronchiseptica]